MTRTNRLRALESWAERVEVADLAEADLTVLQAIAGLAERRAQVEADLLAEVRQARDAGRSWSQIGAALGVSKQAAQRKYAAQL